MMLLSTQTVLSIIDLLLTEAKDYLDNWNEEWDGHLGDLSAPEYCALTSEISILTHLRKIIINGDQRVDDIGRANSKRSRRNKDLFKLAKEMNNEDIKG